MQNTFLPNSKTKLDLFMRFFKEWYTLGNKAFREKSWKEAFKYYKKGQGTMSNWVKYCLKKAKEIEDKKVGEATSAEILDYFNRFTCNLIMSKIKLKDRYFSQI